MALDISVDDNSQETAASDASSVDDQSNYSSAAALALFSAALLAACGGGGGGESQPQISNAVSTDTPKVPGSTSSPIATPTPGSTPTPSTTPTTTPSPTPTPSPVPSTPGFNNFPKAKNGEEAARFLLQSQLEANDTEIAEVQSSTSFAVYVQKQFVKPIRQTGWQWLEQRGYGAAPNTFNFFFNTFQADFMLWKQLFTEPDGMRKRIALALSEFFVASLQSAEFTWRSHGYAQYWDLLNTNAFGNFRQLLEDVTLSPAMGYYLNTKGNQKEDNKGRLPDENYAREVMQLFTIGLYKLNLDGSEQIGPDGKKLESYTQDDVSNLARIFTGYDFDTSDGVRVQVLKPNGTPETYTVESKAFTQKPMSFNKDRHSLLNIAT